MGFFQGTQERVQNSGSKRAISVKATEYGIKLLYMVSKNKIRLLDPPKVDHCQKWNKGNKLTNSNCISRNTRSCIVMPMLQAYFDLN